MKTQDKTQALANKLGIKEIAKKHATKPTTKLKEIKDGIIPDPSAVDPITGQPLEGGGDLGAVPTEPDLESDAMVTDAQFQKDVKSAEI